MEDWLYILLTISFIASAALKSRRKPKGMIPKAPFDTPDMKLPEGWPPMEELTPKPKQKKASTSPKKRSGARRMHPDSQEVLLPEIEANHPKKGYRKPHSTPQATAKPSVHATATESRTAPINTPEREHPDMEGFSLRKAVIWSEILKPKFDEE